MAKKITLVMRVSDDMSEMFQQWVYDHTDKVLFMGTVVDLLDLQIEPIEPDGKPALDINIDPRWHR